MRKMTRTALVLAAMSAMTVATASMAYADTGVRKNVSSTPTTEDTTAEVGEWVEDGKEWTFKIGGTKLDDEWAKIDGVWYYFKEGGDMAAGELVEIDDETYYFYDNGIMHAGGWLEFDADSDQIDEFDEIDVSEWRFDVQNRVEEATYDTVWMYFNADGTAKEDEWYTSEVSGLHYYFDGLLMTCGDYDHIIGDNVYGFAADGHMYYGWEQAYDDHSVLAPNDTAKVWYYYGEGGKKYLGVDSFDALGSNAGYAWRKIEGKWYIFADETASDFDNGTRLQGNSFGTLVTGAYFNNLYAGEGNSNYYYVDGKGVMQTGVVSLPKKMKHVTDTWATWTANSKPVTVATEIWLDGDGKAQTGWNKSKYYTNSSAAALANLLTYKGNVDDDPVAYNASEKDIFGHLVKSAFVKDGANLYYVDSKGYREEDTKMLVGHVSANATDEATLTSIKAGYADGLVTQKDWVSKTNTVGQYNVYVLFDDDGKVYTDGSFRTEKEVKVGSTKYTATDLSININGINAQLFLYPNENNRR